MIVDKRKIDIPYLLKMDRFNENKNKIVLAKLANELLQDDKVIFIDSSSTALYLIDFLRNYKGLQIITNGLMTASLLSEYTDFPINVIGGLIVPKRFTINGSKAMSDIATYNADLAFVSCLGYDFIHGATETTEGEAYVKRAFRKQAQKIILLFTADKFNQTYMYQSLNNQQIDYIVTDYQFSENDLNLMCDYNIKVLATE
ncbi:MAG: DeoR/GlpR transcriptional regulator [Sporolactobacillus sp.]|jgi:DeoR/GlpR family transcriptional regulator of sugar metabolism|nr:DeoR/GlpR transcriptional regulator [Sporolactobacillus sp.]